MALRTGIVTEPAARGEIERIGERLASEIARLFGRSLAIRQVDAGSCNGCELEIAGLTGPHYDLERFGVHFVASPRHADCLLVTGPVTRNMAEALRRTWEATPHPKFVIAVGDCGRDGGMFRGSYRSEEHTSELQSLRHLVCRLLLEKKQERRSSPHIDPLNDLYPA